MQTYVDLANSGGRGEEAAEAILQQRLKPAWSAAAEMSPEPRHEGDYTDRQVDAARRVLVDVGQVLASFGDAIVVVGGWVPDLLIPTAAPEHIGSIDVDLALDAAKLGDGRYAELLKLLLDTGRYEKGDKDFQLVTTVDLEDGEAPVRVEVEFLAPADVKLKKNHPKLVEGFRVLQFPACAAAFGHPESIELEGLMISGAPNTVHLRVASLTDFIIMKAHAVGGRDKPKDVYDLCYCLDEYPDAICDRGCGLACRVVTILSSSPRSKSSGRSSRQLTILARSSSPSSTMPSMPTNAPCTQDARSNLSRSSSASYSLMSPHPYTEDQLVEQPAIALLAELGWTTVNGLDEVLGLEGTFGRETKSEVVLGAQLRAALVRLNPDVPPEGSPQRSIN